MRRAKAQCCAIPIALSRSSTAGSRAPIFISTTMSWLAMSARSASMSSGQGRIRMRSLPSPSGHDSAEATAAKLVMPGKVTCSSAGSASRSAASR